MFSASLALKALSSTDGSHVIESLVGQLLRHLVALAVTLRVLVSRMKALWLRFCRFISHFLRTLILVRVIVLFVIEIALQISAQIKAERCPMFAMENVLVKNFTSC
jgi:hypothetical protein